MPWLTTLDNLIALTSGRQIASDNKTYGEPPKRRKLMWWGIGGGAAVVVVAVVATVLATRKRDSGSGGDTYQGDFNPPSVAVQVGQ